MQANLGNRESVRPRDYHPVDRLPDPAKEAGACIPVHITGNAVHQRIAAVKVSGVRGYAEEERLQFETENAGRVGELHGQTVLDYSIEDIWIGTLRKGRR